MGLGIAMVSADARLSCDQRGRLWLSRRERQTADLLRRHAAAGGEYWAGESDGSGVWIWGEVSREVSEGAVDHGLVVWAADRGTPGADGGELYGELGEFCSAKITAGDGA